MGFKFGSTGFTIGVVEVAIDHIDTDKMTTSTRLKFPLADGKFEIKFFSGINWQEKRNLSIEFQWRQNDPPEEPDEDIEDGIDWEDQEDK